MHPVLLESLERLKARCEEDPRCVGMYLWGSLGQQTADAFSDVDVAIVLAADAYPAFKSELQGLCERLCGPILVWMPEGETEEFVNYAFLFEAGDDLLLYDLSIQTDRHAAKRPPLPASQVLFDRTDFLTGEASAPPKAAYDPASLPLALQNFWVYMYLNGKYYQRRDVYKMLYVQQTLFQFHFGLFRALYPEMEWTWWARDIHHLPESRQQEMLVYYRASEPDAIAQALWTEMDLYSRDAQEACRKWAIPYPTDLEIGVRNHLRHCCKEAGTGEAM